MKFFCITFISKAFSVFCRKFRNVANHAFLVLILWPKKAVGATFFAFCNYAENVFRTANVFHAENIFNTGNVFFSKL